MSATPTTFVPYKGFCGSVTTVRAVVPSYSINCGGVEVSQKYRRSLTVTAFGQSLKYPTVPKVEKGLPCVLSAAQVVPSDDRRQLSVAPLAMPAYRYCVCSVRATVGTSNAETIVPASAVELIRVIP